MDKTERAMIGRAFTRLLGLEAGDRLADELFEARSRRQASQTAKGDGS